MYVGIPKTRTTHHFLLFGECLLKLGLDEAGHLSELQINDGFLQASRVPECQSNPLALELSLEVCGIEIAFLLRWVVLGISFRAARRERVIQK